MSPTKPQRTTKGRSRQAGCAAARAFDALRGRCARALGQTAGFTLTEALTTVIIVGLVTTILAGGIGLAARQYTQQVSNSEAQMLYSSLQKILDTELRFVEVFDYDEASGKVLSFESTHYMAQQSASDPNVMEPTTLLSTVTRLPGDVMLVREPSQPGQLAMASGLGMGMAHNLLLPSASYSYGLQASVDDFTYDSAKNYFRLHLVISRPDGEGTLQPLVAETFTVRPLNIVSRGTGSGGSTGTGGSGSGGAGTGGTGSGGTGTGGTESNNKEIRE